MRFLAVLLAAALLVPASPVTAVQAAARPGVTRATLANGLQVVVVREPLAPVVTTMMNYLVGADDEPIAGLAHAEEHMLFRGSRTLSGAALSQIATLVGGADNAETQNEITQYYFTVPADDLEIALRLEASRAQGVLDTQQLWNQERGAIEQEVARDASSAGYRLYVKALHQLLAGTPYADEGLGTMESFGKQIEAAQLQSFYARWYHPNNAILVIAGDVEPAAALARVRALFGAIPARAVPPRRAVRLGPLRPATFVDRSSEPFTQAFLAYRFPGYDDPDYAAAQVAIDVLNSQRAALYDLVASGKAFAASADAQTFPRAGIALVDVQVAPEVTPAEALRELRGALDAYRRDGVPAELVAAAKAHEVAQSAFARSSISGLASTWSQSLAVEHRTPDVDEAAIARVTAADVDRVLRRYLVDATATTAYAVPAEDANGGGPPPRTAEHPAVVPDARAVLPAWARRALADLHVPATTRRPTATVLPNGLRLIVQPETATHTVVVRGRIRTAPGLQEPAGEEGLASLADALLPYGTTRYDRLAYQRELDEIAADAAIGTSFSLDVLGVHLERGLELLAEGELHPALAADAFATVRAQQVAAVRSAQRSPEYRSRIALTNALYPKNDPARRVATPESIGRLTLEEVARWHATAYRPELATIVVVGDVTPRAAAAAVARWFGDWHGDGPTPVVDPSPAPDNRPLRARIAAADRVQSRVILAQTLRLRRGDPDYAPLQVANAVLSGGFSSLLFGDLRERTGYVYDVDSFFAIGKTRSTFRIEYGAAPQNVAKADALIAADLRRLQTTLLPPERLRTAQAMLLGEVTIAAESYDGLASRLLGYGSDGLPLDQDRIDARRELATTPASLRAALARWIRPDRFVRVILGPAEPRLPSPPG